MMMPAAWLLLLPLATPDVDRFMAGETLAVTAVVKDVPTTVEDARWAGVPALVAPLHAQRTLALPDKTVNAGLASRPAWSMTVKALHNQKDLALLLEWPDATADRVDPVEVQAFADAVALEFPETFGPGIRLPYVGMGDETQHVRVHMLRATASGADLRDAVAAGYGSLTRVDVAVAKGALVHDAKAGTWRAVFVRPLQAPGQDLKAGLVPVAFAAWDGARRERGGNKVLSSWKFLRLEGLAPDAAYVEELSYGYAPVDAAVLARGKAHVESVCIACHRTATLRFAMEGLAPDLLGVGGIATPSYLRDSVMKPSEVIVPPANPNRHQQRSAPPDANRARPNNEALQWFSIGGDGARVSRMPVFAHLTAQDVDAIVAYLRSLDANPS